jgi:hypothetical protein
MDFLDALIFLNFIKIFYENQIQCNFYNNYNGIIRTVYAI